MTTTTVFDAGTVTLPPTGTSSETNERLALVALVLIVAGGVMVVVRRRAV